MKILALMCASALSIGALVTAADAAAYKVDTAKSKVGFRGLWSNESFGGDFQKWDASITFDPAALATSKVTVTIDLASMKGVDAEPELESGMRTPLGFDVARTPTAQFVSKSFRAAGAGKYEVVGDLTLKGMTKELTIPFTLTQQGPNAHAVGEAEINRTDFNVGSGMWGGEDPVAHKVRILFDLNATAAP